MCVCVIYVIYTTQYIFIQINYMYIYMKIISIIYYISLITGICIYLAYILLLINRILKQTNSVEKKTYLHPKNAQRDN